MIALFRKKPELPAPFQIKIKKSRLGRWVQQKRVKSLKAKRESPAFRVKQWTKIAVYQMNRAWQLLAKNQTGLEAWHRAWKRAKDLRLLGAKQESLVRGLNRLQEQTEAAISLVRKARRSALRGEAVLVNADFLPGQSGDKLKPIAIILEWCEKHEGSANRTKAELEWYMRRLKSRDN